MAILRRCDGNAETNYSPRNFALNGAIAFKRNSGDLLELEAMLLFKVLQCGASQVNKLATRRWKLLHNQLSTHTIHHTNATLTPPANVLVIAPSLALSALLDPCGECCITRRTRHPSSNTNDNNAALLIESIRIERLSYNIQRLGKLHTELDKWVVPLAFLFLLFQRTFSRLIIFTMPQHATEHLKRLA